MPPQHNASARAVDAGLNVEISSFFLMELSLAWLFTRTDTNRHGLAARYGIVVQRAPAMVFFCEMTPSRNTMRVGLIILGCDKNTVDAEYVAGILAASGCETIAVAPDDDEPRELDAAVIMTCGFVCDAKEQSIEAIVHWTNRKTRTGDPARVFVAGCLSQRYADHLLESIPEIDGIAGVGQYEALARLVRNDGRERSIVRETPTVEVGESQPRRRLDTKPYAFLKIADGCNHACAFCSIPLMKGKLRSVPPEAVLREARSLLDSGVRELNVVAQDISVYGQDLGGSCDLPKLLRAICAMEGDFWVRCLYCYPSGVTDELIEVMASEPKIVPYLDVPLQHLDPDVLRQMRRPGHDLDIAAFVARLRVAIPGIAIRTTMLVGFPGETPAAHRRMLDGIRRLRFDRLGAFEYSEEEGTAAAEASRRVGAKTRAKRREAVMQAQASIAEALNRERVGTRVRVLIEEYDAAQEVWIGRSAAEAPEVDGCVYAASPKPLGVGCFVEVRIVKADVYDVYAEAIE